MPEYYQNLACTTCTNSINSSSNPATINLPSGAGALFPSSTPFRVTVCNTDTTNAEVMVVMTNISDTLTAYRGTAISTYAAAELPTPTLATHSIGSIVSHNLTAGAMDQIRVDVVNSGTGTASYGTASNSTGNLWIPTDDVLVGRMGTSSYQWWGPMFPVTPSTVESFSWTNQTMMTATLRNNSIVLCGTGDTSGGWEIYGVSNPSTPYSFTMGANAFVMGASFISWGLAVYDGTRITAAGFFNNSGPQFSISRYNSTSSYNSSPLALNFAQNFGAVFIKVKVDSSHLTFYIGADPVNLFQIYQESVSAFMSTITKIGPAVQCSAASGIAVIDLFHWAQGTS